MKPNGILLPLLLTAGAFNHANSQSVSGISAQGHAIATINRSNVSTRAFDFRIIGGKPVDIDARPWMVALVGKGTAATDAFCGASLIAPQWVLTAAHCVVGTNASSLDIVAGVAELNNTNAERISVSDIVLHPNYSDNSLDNDIALLKLETPSTQKTIAYKVPGNADDVGTEVSVSGWGNQSTSGQQFPTKLHTVDLSVTDFDSCNRAYGGGLNNTHLCASNPGGTKDSCQGDSGGPLVTRIQSKDVQVGVVSFGLECASNSHPGVYTRVSQFEGFIDKMIGEGSVVVVDTTPPVPVDNTPEQPTDGPAEPAQGADPPVVTEMQPAVDEPVVTEVDPDVIVPPSVDIEMDVDKPVTPVDGGENYPAEIWVERQFGRVIVGDTGYAWLAVFNATNGDDVVVGNLQIKPSAEITIIGNECDNTELGDGEGCMVELAWAPTKPGDLALDVGVDLFDGAKTDTLNTIIKGKALEPIDIGSSIEQPETDFFTDNNLDWEIDYQNVFEGSECLQTAEIENTNPVVLEGDFDVETDSDLSFSFMVQGGVLVLFINDEAVLELDNAFGWERTEYLVPARATVAWEFRPDEQARVAPKARLDGIKVLPKQKQIEVAAASMQLAEAAAAQETSGGSAGAGSNGPWSLLFLVAVAGFATQSRRRVIK